MTEKRSGGGYPNFRTISDPHQERRDYELNGDSPLVGLLDNPWYPPYVEDRSHYHNCMEIGICVSGSGSIEADGQARHFTDGSILVVGKGLRHSQQNAGMPMTHWRYVLVDEDVILREAPQRHRVTLKRLIDMARRQGLYFEAEDEARELRFVLHMMFELYGRRQSMAHMELEAMVYLLMSMMSRTPNVTVAGTSMRQRSRKPIEPALLYVSENYTRDVRVAQLAASCAMSESYFRKLFVQIMGMSPVEYVNRYRINRAMNLLRLTDETVLSIAGRTGFPSIVTFNRNFQRYAGTSPAEWRKNAHI